MYPERSAMVHLTDWLPRAVFNLILSYRFSFPFVPTAHLASADQIWLSRSDFQRSSLIFTSASSKSLPSDLQNLRTRYYACSFLSFSLYSIFICTFFYIWWSAIVSSSCSIFLSSSSRSRFWFSQNLVLCSSSRPMFSDSQVSSYFRVNASVKKSLVSYLFFSFLHFTINGLKTSDCEDVSNLFFPCGGFRVCIASVPVVFFWIS